MWHAYRFALGFLRKIGCDRSPRGSPAATPGTAGTEPASAVVPGESPESEQP
jgi:hypothetical protein